MSTDPFPDFVRLAPTATKVPSDGADRVIVCGSHGGAYAGYLVAKSRAKAVIREAPVCMRSVDADFCSDVDESRIGPRWLGVSPIFDPPQFVAAWPTTAPRAADYPAGAVCRRFSARHRHGCRQAG